MAWIFENPYRDQCLRRCLSILAGLIPWPGLPLNNGRPFHSHGIQIVPRKGPRRMREETLAIYRMLQGGAFDDRAVKAMTTAYDAAVRELRLADSNDPRADIIARKIIACTQNGELDPARLSELALKDIRPVA
jgi:hypothetical protein